MAHLTNEIPWDLITSNLTYLHRFPGYNGESNLYPCMEPNQPKDLTRFTLVFEKTLEKHAESERKKYPATYPVPSDDDIVLSDEVVKKISPTVHRYRSTHEKAGVKRDLRDTAFKAKLCDHYDIADCKCPVSFNERKMSAFLYKYKVNPCHQFFEKNEEAFYAVEIIKTLILEGEMDALLRICAHPDLELVDWWRKRECVCTSNRLGWEIVAKSSLKVYICLNVLADNFLLWCPKFGKDVLTKDYRHTKAYQNMLREVSCIHNPGEVVSDVHAFHQRYFFGISDKVAETCIRFFGSLTLDDFKKTKGLSHEYLPTVEDVSEVKKLLSSKTLGLPTELVLDIMERADYTPKRMFKGQHHPLTLANRKKLRDHLELSWQILLRCDMFAKALGDSIPWSKLTSNCIVELFGTYRPGHDVWEECHSKIDAVGIDKYDCSYVFI